MGCTVAINWRMAIRSCFYFTPRARDGAHNVRHVQSPTRQAQRGDESVRQACKQPIRLQSFTNAHLWSSPPASSRAPNLVMMIVYLTVALVIRAVELSPEAVETLAMRASLHYEKQQLPKVVVLAHDPTRRTSERGAP